MGGLLGGPKGMLAPLSNYWGGLAPPGPPPPSSYAYVSTNSYVSESDASLNLLLFRFSIALSSSKSLFYSASSVFFSVAIFNLSWSTS